MLRVSIGAKVFSGFQIEPDEFGSDEELFEDRGLLSELVKDEELRDELESSEILKVKSLLESALNIVVQEIGVHYMMSLRLYSSKTPIE